MKLKQSYVPAKCSQKSISNLSKPEVPNPNVAIVQCYNRKRKRHSYSRYTLSITHFMLTSCFYYVWLYIWQCDSGLSSKWKKLFGVSVWPLLRGKWKVSTSAENSLYFWVVNRSPSKTELRLFLKKNPFKYTSLNVKCLFILNYWSLK